MAKVGVSRRDGDSGLRYNGQPAGRDPQDAHKQNADGGTA